MQPSPKPSLSFRKTSKRLFGPRLGQFIFQRELNDGEKCSIEIPTPGILISAPRGVVPHLSRDHIERTSSIKWINVPLETFLEHEPPLPAICPLHSLCGYNLQKHIISISLRDPADIRHVQPNGDSHVTVLSARGAKKVSPFTYKSLLKACQPDLVFSQADICIAPPPHSQKRLIKSIERSFNWLLQILVPEGRPSNLFAHMAGGSVVQARASFSRSLLQPLGEKERLQLSDLKSLNEGIYGYSFDLTPLRHSLPEGTSPDAIAEFLEASLEPLPDTKPRIINGASDPYQVLQLIRVVGIDIFDVQWAFDAAQWGVALDFTFPVQPRTDGASAQRKIGHNLYDVKYAMDRSPVADEFRTGNILIDGEDSRPVCPCVYCSPVFENISIDHSPLTSQLLGSRGIQKEGPESVTLAPPTSRAYLHHLLHTHEMLAHVLLVSHNLAVAEAFFKGIRHCLTDSNPDIFERACEEFSNVYYDHGWDVLEEGKQWWMKVDKERGKGRLSRDKDTTLVDDT